MEQLNLFHEVQSEKISKGAILSKCGKYRFQLWRIWDNSKPKVLFIMHNPSTADADDDDPTIRRCIGFAKSWGYGGIYVGNLSPYRATNPLDLLKIPIDKLTPLENFLHIEEMKDKCSLFVLAYGNPVVNLIQSGRLGDYWTCLKVTQSGNPCHPLYLKSDLKPVKFVHNPKI